MVNLVFGKSNESGMFPVFDFDLHFGGTKRVQKWKQGS